MKKTKGEYVCSGQTDMSCYFRLPKIFMMDDKYKKMSSDAKILYGLMYDRVLLSIKNNWIDANGVPYIIYTIEEVMGAFNCSKSTAVKIIAELDSEKGIGLIEKKRRGLGKPNIIYVLQFMDNNDEDKMDGDSTYITSEDEKLSAQVDSERKHFKSNNITTSMNRKNSNNIKEPVCIEKNSEGMDEDAIGIETCSTSPKIGARKKLDDNVISSFEKDNFMALLESGLSMDDYCEHYYIQTTCITDDLSQVTVADEPQKQATSCRSAFFRLPKVQEVQKADFLSSKQIHDEVGKSNHSNPYENKTNKSKSKSYPSRGVMTDYAKKKMDKMLEFEFYQDLIKKNVEYDILCTEHPKDTVDGMVNLIVDTVCSSAKKVQVNGSNLPREVVSGRLLDLNYMHMKYIFLCLEHNTSKIRNIRQYLITVLYNAPVTMSSYYDAEVRYGEEAYG